MAVPEQDPINSHVASGASGVFAYTFQIAADTDLAVTADGDVLTLNVDYTVTGVGAETGGTIVVSPTPTAGVVITIYRDTQIKRDDDFQTAGDLPAAQVNLELDRLWRALQEIFSGGKGVPTSVRVPAGETINALPTAADRANLLLGFDSSGQVIVVAPTSGSAAALALDLASTSSATKGDYLIGIKQPMTGSVGRTLHEKNAETVSVKDFGAVGDGVTDDRAAIQAAFNASKSVYFPAGTYWLGTYGSADNIIDLSALGDGISVHCDNGVELVMQTTASVMPRIFYLLNNSNFSCDHIRFRDTGYDSSINWKGAIGFYLDCTASASWGDVKLPAIYGKNLVACVQVVGGNAANRVRGVKIGQLFSDDCYYGFNAQNNGDGVAIDNLVAFQNYRAYFVYGCTDHKVKIFNRNARSGSGAVNISRSVGGLNTSGIDVTYVARDMTVGITHVLINHIDLLGGEISNIRLNLDIRSSVVYTPLRFVNYTGSGGSETSGASSNLVYDVTVSGSCDVQASAVTAVAAYASRRHLNFTAGLNFFYDTTIPALFALDRQGRSQAVIWTASVTNPVLGNGTLTGSHDLVGGLCTYSVSLTAGSTTTYGSGDWSFSAPFASTVMSVGSVWVLDNGTAYYIGTCIISAGSSTIQCYSNAASGFRNTVPMTWANGDQLQLTISYPIS